MSTGFHPRSDNARERLIEEQGLCDHRRVVDGRCVKCRKLVGERDILKDDLKIVDKSNLKNVESGRSQKK